MPLCPFASVLPLTPIGRGAVATVAVWGTSAGEIVARRFTAANGTSAAELPLDRITFGRFRSLNDSEEELVICRTREDVWEIHCHGGSAAVQAIVAALTAEGAALATEDAWLAEQSQSLIQREALSALAAAATERSAKILLRQYQGRLEEELTAIETLDRADPAAQARREKLLATWHWGQHLTRPWQVVLCGPPNVGKSSLVNALVGYERAIVQDLPGTTRDVVTTHIVAAGWQIALSDTAGRRASTDPLEQAGIGRAESQMHEADLILLVTDHENQSLDLPDFTAKVLHVRNKIDLAPPSTSTNIQVSARTGQGIPELLQQITHTLVPDPNIDHAAVIFTDRQRTQLASNN